MGVTITDIAKKAGVTAPVVSAVVNGNFRNTRVGKEKRERIERLVKELNYVPNGTARSLARKKTDTLNLVIPSVRFFELDLNNRFIMGVQQSAEERGYQLKFTSLAHNYSAYDTLKNLIADGLMIFLWGDRQYDVIESLRRFGYPIMAVYAYCDLPGVHNVFFDQRKTMYDLTMHCMRQGYRNVFLGGVYPHGHFQQQGRQGIEDAVKEADAHLEMRYYDLSLSADRNRELIFRKGREMADDLLASRELPELIMCTHDELALGVIQRLHEKGLSVPGDIGVTGCGDNDLARVLKPELTTVGNNIMESGKVAGDLLLDVLQDTDKDVRRARVGMEPIIRHSTREL